MEYFAGKSFFCLLIFQYFADIAREGGCNQLVNIRPEMGRTVDCGWILAIGKQSAQASLCLGGSSCQMSLSRSRMCLTSRLPCRIRIMRRVSSSMNLAEVAVRFLRSWPVAGFEAIRIYYVLGILSGAPLKPCVSILLWVRAIVRAIHNSKV